MTKTVLEVALNGPWGREHQPLAPILARDLIAEGIACAKAGADIVHLHAYDEATGRQNDDADTYARIIEGIREQVDVRVYPTLPLRGSGLTGEAGSSAARFAHVRALAKRGLIDMTVVDPGSVNFARIGATDEPGFTYLNPEADIREGLSVCSEFGLTPGYAIYEPGFTRMGSHLASRFTGVPTPLYRFMFSDQFAWGFPPRGWALKAHLALLNEVAPGAPWMVAGLGVDIAPLISEAVARGGHVRVGLEDAPFGSEIDNVTWVERARRAIEKAAR